MKSLTQPKWSTAANAWGRDVTSARQCFQIEEGDVGTTRAHHRGYCQSGYKFKPSDVGRTISVYTDNTGWTCWIFDTSAPQNKQSAQRFAVDVGRGARQEFSSLEDAMRFAREGVYLSDQDAKSLTAELRAGHAVTWAYGFASVEVQPIQ